MIKPYFHTVGFNAGPVSIKRCDDVKEIFQAGGIFSQKKSFGKGLEFNKNHFEQLDDEVLLMRFWNGTEFISVCQRADLPFKEYYNTVGSFYPIHVIKRVGIIIDGSVVTTKAMQLDENSQLFYNRANKIDYILSNDNSRFSIYMDEYQVRDSIPISAFIGLYYPFEYIASLIYVVGGKNPYDLNSDLMKEYHSLKYMLKRYHLEIPIIDSSNDEYLQGLIPINEAPLNKKQIILKYHS